MGLMTYKSAVLRKHQELANDLADKRKKYLAIDFDDFSTPAIQMVRIQYLEAVIRFQVLGQLVRDLRLTESAAADPEQC